jgi:hypothetical protein
LVDYREVIVIALPLKFKIARLVGFGIEDKKGI